MHVKKVDLLIAINNTIADHQNAKGQMEDKFLDLQNTINLVQGNNEILNSQINQKLEDYESLKKNNDELLVATSKSNFVRRI